MTVYKLIVNIILLSFFCTSISWSQKFPTLGEIYDYNPGDEFHIAHFYCCNPLSFQLEQIEIIEKTHYGSTAIYTIRKNVFDFITTSPPSLVDTTAFLLKDTLIVEHLDSVIFGEDDFIQVNPLYYNGRITCVHSYVVFDNIKQERYTVGCGQVFNGWMTPSWSTWEVVDSLIYYSKGNEQWGKTLLGEHPIAQPSKFIFYPNPVSDVLFIKLMDPEISRIQVEIFNLQGLKISNHIALATNPQNQYCIDFTTFRKGIYFVYMSTGKEIISFKCIKD